MLLLFQPQKLSTLSLVKLKEISGKSWVCSYAVMSLMSVDTVEKDLFQHTNLA